MGDAQEEWCKMRVTQKQTRNCSHMDKRNPLMPLEHLWQRLSVKIMTESVKVNSLS